MSEFIPALNSSGTFLLKKPISDKINPQTSLTCKSIRKISELIANGTNVYKEHYLANGLSETTYEDDRKNDVSIIGLYDGSSVWYYIPSTQINAYPDISGVAYRRMAIGIDIGPIAESYDLSILNESINELVFTHLGITPEVRILSISEKAMVKQSEHDAIEKMRKGKVDVNKTVFVRIKNLEEQISVLTKKNSILEEHILRTINQ